MAIVKQLPQIDGEDVYFNPPVKELSFTVNEDYVYNSDLEIKAFKIGNLVIVQFGALPFIQAVPNYTEIIYGLPKSKNYQVFMLTSLGLAGGTVRLAINQNGNIQIHWGAPSYYGESPNMNYGGILVYETSE